MKNKLQYLIELEQSYHFTKILFKGKLVISYQLKNSDKIQLGHC